MHTILGAGGIIADGLAKELVSRNEPVKLVSRNPRALPGTEIQAADITDLQQTLSVLRDASVAYLCVGLKYDFSVWRKQWPAIMNNVIEACKQTGARLIFFDNVYMYGIVEGKMTEDTPYQPCSKKGDLRARIATQLMSEVRKGNITAMIARSADFYGPGASKTSVLNRLTFDRLAKNSSAQWLFNDSRKHSFTYVPDAVKAISMLSADADSWNQVWHLPTAPDPPTGREFISLIAGQLGVRDRHTVLKKWMIGMAGLFNRTIAELYEMGYQYEYDYLFDSSKFEKAFHFAPASYREGITEMAKEYQ